MLYTSDALAALVSNGETYVDAGVNKYTVGIGGVVTEEAISQLGTSGYYYAGTFTSGTTVLYTDDALTTTAIDITTPVNIGDISDPVDGLDDSITTDAAGVVTITYGEEVSSNDICLGNTTYYYTGTFNNGNALYSNDALTCLATCVLENAGDLNLDGIADFACTDANGIISILNGQCYDISASAYYSFQGMENGSSVYSDSNLTSLYNDAVIKINDRNSDNISDFMTISNGIICYINGSCIENFGYYTGTATSIGNKYYCDGSFETEVGTFADCIVDINSDGIIDSVQFTNGNLVQIIDGRTVTIDGCTVYWLNAGAYDNPTCLNGETLYADGSMTTTLCHICLNIGDVCNSDEINDYLCTDANGVASIIAGS